MTAQVIDIDGIDESHGVGESSAAAVNEGRLQSPIRIPSVPINPYDDSKYFSTLTIVGENGTERPIFKFHRHPDTVEEQWAEFKYGLHGQPPVEQLEELYRAKWRNNTYGRSWFTRRKAFWDKMKEMLVEGKTEQQALDVMRRLAEGSVPSLIAQLCRERGHGSRSDRRKDQFHFQSNERGRCDSCDEEAAIDSDEKAMTARKPIGQVL
ncbi:protein MSN1 [Colletotrichum liriopes]|uniref:Protein MSN1 n=1 Tax=Colletotrichum liriopes TaxID=708192 RepID=A0AA37LXZ4_9PEZI|nr:protein MSN1 [Colletotrichum liriopes]